MILTTGKNAFSIIEIIVVLAIISLIMGMSIPFFSSFSRGTGVKAASRDVSSLLNAARSNAITKRENYSVVFEYDEELDDYTGRYWIEDSSSNLIKKKYNLPKNVKFFRPSNPYESITFDNNKATFTPAGGLKGVSSAVWVSKGDKFKRIYVNSVTGKIKVDEGE